MRIFISIIFVLTLFSCGTSENSERDTKEKDSLYALAIEQLNDPSSVIINEKDIFRTMIDSIYPVILKWNFDTLKVDGIYEYTDLEKHRLISVLMAKKQIKKPELNQIKHVYACISKHNSIKKPDSNDLVIEEYVCENSEIASFWFNLIYNCYMTNENPIGEPMKEPYKLWQSDNRIVHVYARAEMWRTAMDSVNKSLMENFVFTKSRND